LDLPERCNTPIDKRLCSALIRSIEIYNQENSRVFQGRSNHYFVPLDFAKLFCMGKETPEELMHNKGETKFREAMWMMRYIQHCYRLGDYPQDVYAKALCSNKEISQAIARTQHRYMMKRLRDQGMVSGRFVPLGDVASTETPKIDYFAKPIYGRHDNIERAIPGYSDEIVKDKKTIINRALALYMITDDQGKIHWKNYNTKPVRGLAAK
jgi:hypothetical protein